MSNSNISSMCSRRSQDKKNQARALALAALQEDQRLRLAATRQNNRQTPPATRGALHDPHNDNNKHVLMQKQLALLFHTQKCPTAVAECTTPHCGTMKSVLVHMNACVQKQVQGPYIEDLAPQQKCAVPYCASSRAILAHWKNCAARAFDMCDICEPVTVKVKPDQRTSVPQPTKGTKASKPAATAAQFRHCSWTGSMEWHQRAKALQNMRNSTMTCNVYSATRLKTACWPDKLHLKLIPAQLVGQVAGAGSGSSNPLAWEGQHVLLKFDQLPEVAELQAALKAGSYGYVHFDSTGPGGGVGCPLKMLILTYDEERGAFVGCLPSNQKEFVKRLRYVVQAQIQVQNRNQQQQRVTSSGARMETALDDRDVEMISVTS